VVLNEQQTRDLWNALAVGLSKLPFFIPREMVLARIDSGMTEIPPSLLNAQVGDVLEQIRSWRLHGGLR